MAHLRSNLLASASAVLLLQACGSGSIAERFPAARNLLAREPDRILDQPGRLAPVKRPIFGRYCYGPWEPVLGLFEGQKIAWAKSRRIRMLLPSIRAEEREIRIQLMAPEGAPAEGVSGTVSLNLASLGSFQATAKLQELSFAAPAALWRHGENWLEVSVDHLTQVGPDRSLGFGIGAVEYASPRPIVLDPAAIRMKNGTSFAYWHQLQREAVLVLEGRAASGRLDVVLHHVDPDTGEGSPLGKPLHVPIRDGVLRAEVPLPASTERVLETELSWLASAEQELVIDRLEVREPSGLRRDSVIFISVDTLGARHMSLYGLPRKTTPRLEELARDFVVFDRCRANAPWTVPSYMSQFTGLVPRAHDRRGAEGLSPWEEYELAQNRWTLAEAFRASGYRTAAFVDNPWMRRGFGFLQGFEQYDVSATEIPQTDPLGGIDHVVPRALEWLDSTETAEPFFLFLQVCDPHAPYIATAPWKGAFDGDGLIDESWRIPVGFDQAFAFGCLRASVMASLYSADATQWPAEVPVAPFAAAYHEKVLQVDAGIDRFVSGLRERGLYDRCILVISADHGESTVQHDYFFDHSLLYDEVLHVPLLIKPPFSAGSGRRVRDVVQLIDLYPTLLELAAGQPQQAHVHGRSVVPLLEGEPLPSRPAYAEGGLFMQGAIEVDGWKLILHQPKTGSYQSLITHPRLDRQRLAELAPELVGRWYTHEQIASIVDANPELNQFLFQTMSGYFRELYRIAEDAGEAHDLAAQHPDVVQRLEEVLAEGYKIGEAARAKASFFPTSIDLSAEEIEELRGLGYVGD